MRTVKPWLVLSGFVMFLCGIGFTNSKGQDIEPEELKKRVVASLLKVENYAGGVLKGRMILRDTPGLDSRIQVQFRGSKVYYEQSFREAADEEKRKHLDAVFDAMGTTGMLHLTQFDGKKLRKFNPYNLEYTEQNVVNNEQAISDLCVLPWYWVRMGANSLQRFARVIESERVVATIEKVENGVWKLSQTGLGQNLPNAALVGIKERFIIVDEKCDYLVTEYYGEGHQGVLTGTLEWANQDGNWYVKHGKQTLGNKTDGSTTYAEWFIDEASFDVTKVTAKFDDLESKIPFATKMTFLDERQKELSSQHKGGKDGETEFKLRELARFKKLKELR